MVERFFRVAFIFPDKLAQLSPAIFGCCRLRDILPILARYHKKYEYKYECYEHKYEC